VLGRFELHDQDEMGLQEILLVLLERDQMSDAERSPLLASVAATAKVFGLAQAPVEQALDERLARFRQVYSGLAAWANADFWDAAWVTTAWNFWLPLAMQLSILRREAQRPIVQGVLGGQGTGKTTLGRALTLILQAWGDRTFSLSLDDLYKTYADRLQLRQRDPRLIWRGPPGTHDIEMGLSVLQALRQRQVDQPIAIPRFDKSLHQGAGDRVASELVSGIDIVLFEGWFVGCRPVEPSCFERAPFPIQTEADRTFARDMNARLHDYLPLWNCCDRLLILYPADYRLSRVWRQQAEQKMRSQGKSGMSDAEIEAFVDYFWKALHPELFVTPLVRQPGIADLVVEIDARHRPQKIAQPGA